MQYGKNEFLNTPIEFLKGVGPKRAETLQKELEIFTFGDLLFHFPFRYIDKSKFTEIGDIRSDKEFVQLKGKLSGIKRIGKGRGARLTASLTDGSGSIDLVWFKGVSWFEKSLKNNLEYIAYGKPSLFNGAFNITHPELELLTEAGLKKGKLEPVYPSTENLKSKWLNSKGLQKLMRTLINKLPSTTPQENLPQEIREKYRLIDRPAAFRKIHLPDSLADADQASRRLKFEELFFIQLRMLRHKYDRQEASEGHVFGELEEYFNPFFKNVLPFELTNAQKRVTREIRKDLTSGKQMNRLLQGDVGSGKTIVAVMTMLMAIDNKFQACLMAPTEILAIQHYNGISKLLEQVNVKVDLLTGSVKGAERKRILEDVKEGTTHILIGTHALIEKNVLFKNIGLAIIDEQHRFGVEQRARMWQKNKIPPHILVMTATPIPRTLAMTVYGDLDISVIDELPAGRKPIKTVHKKDSDRLRVFGFMKEEIAKGRQIYVVYPLIHESEKLDYKNLMDGFESISRAFPLPDYKVSIVHGQMNSEAKDFEMNAFVEGRTDIMVSTTVIEVGVDVPNATAMIIENAERFGLAQLHQLRGRVGRGGEQSYCILMTSEKLSNDARTRIKTMVETNDGFRISEVDMRLRGYGNIQGTQQSGVLKTRIADLLKDQPILKEARHTAQEIISSDPLLKSDKNQLLKHDMNLNNSRGFTWSMIS